MNTDIQEDTCGATPLSGYPWGLGSKLNGYPWGKTVKVSGYPQGVSRKLSGYPGEYLIKLPYPQPPGNKLNLEEPIFLSAEQQL